VFHVYYPDSDIELIIFTAKLPECDDDTVSDAGVPIETGGLEYFCIIMLDIDFD